MEGTSLELTFSIEEVCAILRDLNGDKAPSPYGFTVMFWQSSWEMVKDDVMRMFNEFHASGKFVESLNIAFLVMIPKKGGQRTTSRIFARLVWWEVFTNCWPRS